VSDFSTHSVTAPPSVQAPPPVAPPKPPKSQSDHKPANEATSSRGPAVVLSGAFAKPPEKQGQSSTSNGGSQGQSQNQSQGQSQTVATGQHINHVI
jgi:hypothetical protein